MESRTYLKDTASAIGESSEAMKVALDDVSDMRILRKDLTSGRAEGEGT